jgi:O-antigen/teichoic acid export membrane protein
LFYREAQVIPILRVLSFSFVVSGLSIAQQALLTRQMAFDKLARIELMSVVIGGGVGIGMASSGMGVWSLVGQTLCQSVVTTILLWIASPWRPQLKLDLMEVRSVASYSLNLSGFNVFNYFVRNADNLLIGRYLGASPLGYYSLAYRLMLYPLQNVSGVLGRVLFPAFVQMQDDHERFRRAYLRVCASISAISFPMMLGLLSVATPLVVAVLGPRWMPVAALLIILAPVGMAQSIGTTVGHIYKAKGRTDWMFWWGLFTGVLTVLFFVVGLRWGVVGVAAAYAIRSYLLIYLNYAIPFKLIGLAVRDLAVALWPTLRASLAMFGTVVALRIFLAWMGIAQPWLVLGVSILTGVLIYSGLMLWSRPPVLRDMLQLLPVERVTCLQRAAARITATSPKARTE